MKLWFLTYSIYSKPMACRTAIDIDFTVYICIHAYNMCVYPKDSWVIICGLHGLCGRITNFPFIFYEIFIDSPWLTYPSMWCIDDYANSI